MTRRFEELRDWKLRFWTISCEPIVRHRCAKNVSFSVSPGHGLKQPEAISLAEDELAPVVPTLDALRANFQIERNKSLRTVH